MERKRLLIWVLGIPAVLFAVAWALLRSDTVPNAKASFMAMTQALSLARESASKCWREGHVAVAGCEAVKSQMPVSPSSDVVYLVTDQGALVGIDYSNRVTVILTPRVDGDELNWRCGGSPLEAITKLCSDLAAMKR